MVESLNARGYVPGVLQLLDATGTTRAERPETTGGSSAPYDPVARDAGEDDPAEAVLLGSGPPLVGAVGSLELLTELATADDCNDETLLQAMEAAVPYQQKTGKSTFWVETGLALSQYSYEKILSSVFAENQKASWAHLLSDFVQINKARDGDLVITVAEEATREGMMDQTIHIVDERFSVITPYIRASTTPSRARRSEFHDLFCMDIVVYFCSEEAPGPLVINGHPVDQIKLQGVYYGVFTRDDAKSPSPRRGNVSIHCLDLDNFPGQQGFIGTRLSTSDADNKRQKTQPVDASRETATSAVPGSSTTREASFSPPPPCTETYIGSHAMEVDDDGDDGLHTETTFISTSAAVDQPPQLEMEVTFQLPKKSKRGRLPSNEGTILLSPNMYAALDHFQLDMTRVQWPSKIPCNTYTLQERELSPATFDSKEYVRRLTLKGNSMVLDPNNMTLQEIERALFDLDAPGRMNVAAQQAEMLLATSQTSPNMVALAERGIANELWYWLSEQPIQANFTFMSLLTSEPLAMARLTRLHAWHRWTVATRAP
ncbi:hypothetical protein DYB32_010315 [Aphanomyces invadans]|uniref:Uncharacterized protein n=1 Tax=Aphanomyces invadans TaxID=157072 RepID=A0A3R6ZHA2_9STRA|nr:hypothetical protein DYB32_010315 [Aphanomyces invadans]